MGNLGMTIFSLSWTGISSLKLSTKLKMRSKRREKEKKIRRKRVNKSKKRIM